MAEPFQRMTSEELSALNERLERQLYELESSGRSKRKLSGASSLWDLSRKFAWELFRRGLCTFLLLAAPFFILIRVSMHLYSGYQLNGWMALGGGVLASLLLLVLYVLAFTLRYRRDIRFFFLLNRGMMFLVAVYLIYGLLFYSGVNMKTPEIREYYRSMHPILRVTLATFSLTDRNLLITDIRRTRSDYAEMGLPEKQHSLHYVQESGYVHAVDLRTIGRSETGNRITAAILELLGFRTIRHVGTADHLHLYLPLQK